MKLALSQAGAHPEDVTHINAHATSTPVGDIDEYTALLGIFGDRAREIPVSATKSATGHLLGGTGAIESMFTVLAVQNRIAPPTINLVNQDPDIPAALSDRPQPLGDGPQLRDQQLLRLRRTQRRCRDPLLRRVGLSPAAQARPGPRSGVGPDAFVGRARLVRVGRLPGVLVPLPGPNTAGSLCASFRARHAADRRQK